MLKSIFHDFVDIENTIKPNRDNHSDLIEDLTKNLEQRGYSDIDFKLVNNSISRIGSKKDNISIILFRGIRGIHISFNGFLIVHRLEYNSYSSPFEEYPDYVDIHYNNQTIPERVDDINDELLTMIKLQY